MLRAALLAMIFFAGRLQADETNCVIQPSELVSWWRLQDGSDALRRNPGVVVGNLEFVPGKVDLCMSSAGARAGLVVSNSPSLNFGVGADFSIEAWVRPSFANTSFELMDIVDKRIAPDIFHAVGYELVLTDGRLAFQMSDSLDGPVITVGAGPDLRGDAWHHVAVTIHRGTTNGGALYIDGSAALTFDTTPQSGSLENSAPLLIGLHPTYPMVDGDFRGAIDEVAIYARALSGAEIASIFNAGSAGKCLVNPPLLSVAAYAGLTIAGAMGHTYDIEYTTSIDQSNWLHLGSVTLTQQVQLWFDTNSISGPRRFYRLAESP